LNEGSSRDGKKESTVSGINTFSEWAWEPPDQRFVLTIRFKREHSKSKKAVLILKSLKKTLMHAQDLNEKLD